MIRVGVGAGFGIACLLVVASASVAVANTTADGVAAFKVGSYKKAAAILVPLATKGDATALFFVGRMYEKGLGGLKQDQVQAHCMYNKSQAKQRYREGRKARDARQSLERTMSREKVNAAQKCATEDYARQMPKRPKLEPVERAFCDSVVKIMSRIRDRQYPGVTDKSKELFEHYIGDNLIMIGIVKGLGVIDYVPSDKKDPYSLKVFFPKLKKTRIENMWKSCKSIDYGKQEITLYPDAMLMKQGSRRIVAGSLEEKRFFVQGAYREGTYIYFDDEQ